MRLPSSSQLEGVDEQSPKAKSTRRQPREFHWNGWGSHHESTRVRNQEIEEDQEGGVDQESEDEEEGYEEDEETEQDEEIEQEQEQEPEEEEEEDDDDDEGEDQDEEDEEDEEDGEDGEDDAEDDEDEDEDEEENEDADDEYRDSVHDLENSSYGSFLLRDILQRPGVGSSADSNILNVMQRLVSGMNGSPFERQLSEYDALVDNLTQRDDVMLIMESLNELLERLLMMNGITAERVIPPNKLSNALIGLLKDPQLFDDLELHLVACRCLYNFIEVNQDFIHETLNSGAVEVLVDSIMKMTYSDLSEQALQTLEMISREPGSHTLIITSGGFKACLQNLDFLTIHAQRKCLTIIANACTNVPTIHFQMIAEEFGKLAAVAENHSDNIVLENTWLAISRIMSSYKTRPDLLEELFLNELLLIQMTSVICNSCNPSNTDSGLKHASTISLIKSLIIVVSNSVEISLLLLKIRIGRIISISLSNFKRAEDARKRNPDLGENGSGSQAVSIEALIAAPKELLAQFLKLIAYLLPITSNVEHSPFLGCNHRDHDVKKKMNLERAAFYRNNNLADYATFVDDIWPLLIGSFQATIDYEIRKCAIIDMTRIVTFSQEETAVNMKGIEDLAGVLTSVVANGRKRLYNADPSSFKDTHSIPNNSLQDILLTSLIILATQVLQKSNGAWLCHFRKEGLFDDLEDIIRLLERIPSELNDVTTANEIFMGHDDFHYHQSGFSDSSHNYYLDHEVSKDSQAKVFNTTVYQNLRHACLLLKATTQESHSVSGSGENPLKVLISHLEVLGPVEGLQHSTNEQWNMFWEKLKELILHETNPVSTYELISLGLIRRLLDVFTNNTHYQWSQNWTAISSFRRVFADTRACSRLVESLQNCLTRTESFEIVSSGLNTNGNGKAVAALMKQIKLKVIPPEISQFPGLREYTLSVHSIATFKSVQCFLVEKSYASTSSLTGVRDAAESIDSQNSDLENLEDMVFMIDNNEIPIDTTIFGAVYRAIQIRKGTLKVDPREVWSTSHTVTFCRKIDSSNCLQQTPMTEEKTPLDPTTASILDLLKAVNTMCQMPPVLCSSEVFMNWKLTVKLNRQLEEPLLIASGTIPIWCIVLTRDYPFLFPMETRMFFLQSTSFGYSRLIYNWQLRASSEQYSEESVRGHNNESSFGLQLGRPMRRKVRISRSQILQSALKVLHLYGASPGVLEIEYYDEVGSGLGPTLEFYSAVSKEFQRASLLMWRSTDSFKESDDTFVAILNGLFPLPIDENQVSGKNGKKILHLFSALGMFVARSLIDSRIVDISFNTVFLKLVQGHLSEKSFQIQRDDNLIDLLCILREVDLTLATSLESLFKYLSVNWSDTKVPVEDLALTFVLPGYPEFELLPGGSTLEVNSDNLRSYIQLVVQSTLFTGVKHQVEAFKEGFTKVFPISSLAIFSPRELNAMFGVGEEDWSVDTLSEAINADHGYTRDSRAIRALVTILNELTVQERRQFLQFLTGSPKLPIGGFKAMKPEFTVVKKRADDGLKADDYLPSVMTCANYLKLPEYSLTLVMREKVLHAITEGAGAFHLS